MTRVHGTFLGSTTDTTAIRYLFRDDAGPVGQDLDQRSLRVLDAAKAYVPVRTGTLLATLRRESGQGTLGPYRDVIVGREGITPYTGWVIFGTEPHQIVPRRARALRWATGGRVFYARRVQHPGTRANNFLTRALGKAE